MSVLLRKMDGSVQLMYEEGLVDIESVKDICVK